MIHKQYIKNASLFLKENKIAVLTVIFFTIIADIIFFPKSSDIVFFGLVGIYCMASRIYKLHSKVTFMFCFLLLLIMFGEFLVTKASTNTEKAAVWLFLFTAIGIVQQIKE